MHDHLTKLYGKLISDLNNDGRIQTAWYYSRKVFAIDKEEHRNNFDIMDTVSEKKWKISHGEVSDIILSRDRFDKFEEDLVQLHQRWYFTCLRVGMWVASLYRNQI